MPTTLPGYAAPTITGIELWQYNLPGYYDRGIASTTVSYSTDNGTIWGQGYLVNTFAAGTQDPVTAQRVALPNVPAGVTTIMFSGFTNFGDPNVMGFNEIRFVGTASAVPQPSTILLLVTGLIGLLAYAWRKRR